MNSLLLFFIFFVVAIIITILTYILLKPLKSIKKQIAVFIHNFVFVFVLCLTYQLCVTKLNYGIFRAYFTISYILGMFLTFKLILEPLEKFFSMLYNTIKNKWSNKECKITKNLP